MFNRTRVAYTKIKKGNPGAEWGTAFSSCAMYSRAAVWKVAEAASAVLPSPFRGAVAGIRAVAAASGWRRSIRCKHPQKTRSNQWARLLGPSNFRASSNAGERPVCRDSVSSALGLWGCSSLKASVGNGARSWGWDWSSSQALAACSAGAMPCRGMDAAARMRRSLHGLSALHSAWDSVIFRVCLCSTLGKILSVGAALYLEIHLHNKGRFHGSFARAGGQRRPGVSRGREAAGTFAWFWCPAFRECRRCTRTRTLSGGHALRVDRERPLFPRRVSHTYVLSPSPQGHSIALAVRV